MDWAAVVTGFSIGIAFTAVPGPVTTEATRRAIRGGFRPGFLVNLGSCLGDVAWAALGLSGAAVLLAHDGVAVALGLVGVGFLFALARDAIRAATRPPSGATTPAHSGRGDLMVGAIFSLANPSGIAFWAGIGTGMLAALGDTSPATIASLLVAYLVAGMALGCTFVALAAWGGRRAGERVRHWVELVSGVALGGFALRLLWDTAARAHRWLAPALRALA